MGISERRMTISAEEQKLIFGQFDAFAKIIERSLNITMISRDDELKLIGDAERVERAEDVLKKLVASVQRKEEITEQKVSYILALAIENNTERVDEIDKDIICHTINGKPIRPKTIGQKDYIELIRNKMIVFGIGPAGTGKTYLAMATAINAFKNDEVGRIILTRPAIEAGEKLGFLPGDLQSKVDPYLRPLYDALYEMFGTD